MLSAILIFLVVMMCAVGGTVYIARFLEKEDS